jgi:hypothetical protein
MHCCDLPGKRLPLTANGLGLQKHPEPGRQQKTVNRRTASAYLAALGVGDGGSERMRALNCWYRCESVLSERSVAGLICAMIARVFAMRSSSIGCVENQPSTADGFDCRSISSLLNISGIPFGLIPARTTLRMPSMSD